MKRRTMLGMLATLPAASSFATEKSGTLVLGQSAAFSGPAAQLGIQLNRGARMYFDQVNAMGATSGPQAIIEAMIKL